MRDQNLIVIKALFASKPPLFDQAGRYDVSGWLVECGQGRLPGGNAKTWDWRAARRLATDRPLVPGESYTVLVAYHATDDAFGARHTERGTGEITLDPAP